MYKVLENKRVSYFIKNTLSLRYQFYNNTVWHKSTNPEGPWRCSWPRCAPNASSSCRASLLWSCAPHQRSWSQTPVSSPRCLCSQLVPASPRLHCWLEANKPVITCSSVAAPETNYRCDHQVSVCDNRKRTVAKTGHGEGSLGQGSSVLGGLQSSRGFCPTR